MFVIKKTQLAITAKLITVMTIKNCVLIICKIETGCSIVPIYCIESQ